MKIIVRYAKRNMESREKIREAIFVFLEGTQWQDYVIVAAANAQPGERIVAIIEGGYH